MLEVGEDGKKLNGENTQVGGEDLPKRSPLQSMLEEATVTESVDELEDLLPIGDEREESASPDKTELIHQPRLTRATAKKLGLNPSASLLLP